MTKKVVANKSVTWLSDEITNVPKVSISFHYYEKFQFKKLIAEIGDFVLISNADSADPDTEAGCDPARIISLYEDTTNSSDPFRAKVQWYSRPEDLPASYFSNKEPIEFLEREVFEDHRPFDTDVSIETFFKKCSITLSYTKDADVGSKTPYHYICRYRLMAISKRKVQIEPVLEEERKALQYLTPVKESRSSSKTPSSLVKRMGRVSISDKNWSVSKNDGTKLLLKRAIFADKNEKDSPKKVTPKVTPKKKDTPRSEKLIKSNIDDVSMELQENSDDELPTLIIREHEPTTPKRKTSMSQRVNSDDEIPTLIIRKHAPKFTPTRKTSMSLRENSDGELPTLIIREHAPKFTPKRKTPISKTNEITPKKVLLFDDEDNITVTRSGRVTKSPKNYINEGSLVKLTRRQSILSKINEEIDDSPIKRTERKSVRKINYIEPELSPVKRTPRKSIRKYTDESDDDFKPTPKTPRTPRTPRNTRTPKATPEKTPKRSVTRKIISQLTPTLHTRAHSVDNVEEYLNKDNSLPGREHQMDLILSFVRDKLLNGISGCMYISGVPGTGKTATVCSALKLLKEEPDLPHFQLLEINGMRIAEPRQAFVQIYKQLTGKSVVWEQAHELLEKRFKNPGPRRTPTVLLVDELDALCTRRQDVLYSIMEWSVHNWALLTILAVANTMDLPERALHSRVASRLGFTRLTFPPYTHTQLQRIVASRLAGADVTPDAVQLIARKVAAISGDARRALALCARVLELAGAQTASLGHVARALDEAYSKANVRAIRGCAPVERLMLRAVAAEAGRTGSEETTLSRALTTAAAIVALDGRPYKLAQTRAPTSSQAHAACTRLAEIRLLFLEPKPNEPRLSLNCSVDDVHYATKQICY